jgi:hypothetical protein
VARTTTPLAHLVSVRGTLRLAFARPASARASRGMSSEARVVRRDALRRGSDSVRVSRRPLCARRASLYIDGEANTSTPSPQTVRNASSRARGASFALSFDARIPTNASRNVPTGALRTSRERLPSLFDAPFTLSGRQRFSGDARLARSDARGLRIAPMITRRCAKRLLRSRSIARSDSPLTCCDALPVP